MLLPGMLKREPFHAAYNLFAWKEEYLHQLRKRSGSKINELVIVIITSCGTSEDLKQLSLYKIAPIIFIFAL